MQHRFAYCHAVRSGGPGRLRLALALSLGLWMAALAHAQPDATNAGCGELRNAYGPYDYRTFKSGLEIVESSHFTPQVENLIAGVSGPIGGDIDYTLRAYPNHHRALLAMTRLGQRLKTIQPPGAHWVVECYYIRALRFVRDDHVVRMLYARYLGELLRTAEAIRQLEDVSAHAGDSGFTHYNVGLVYAEFREYDRALQAAHRALALGFQRDELKRMLMRVGKWSEPPPAAAAPAASASDAAPVPASAPAQAAASGAMR